MEKNKIVIIHKKWLSTIQYLIINIKSILFFSGNHLWGVSPVLSVYEQPGWLHYCNEHVHLCTAACLTR